MKTYYFFPIFRPKNTFFRFFFSLHRLPHRTSFMILIYRRSAFIQRIHIYFILFITSLLHTSTSLSLSRAQRIHINLLSPGIRQSGFSLYLSLFLHVCAAQLALCTYTCEMRASFGTWNAICVAHFCVCQSIYSINIFRQSAPKALPRDIRCTRTCSTICMRCLLAENCSHTE